MHVHAEHTLCTLHRPFTDELIHYRKVHALVWNEKWQVFFVSSEMNAKFICMTLCIEHNYYYEMFSFFRYLSAQKLF